MWLYRHFPSYHSFYYIREGSDDTFTATRPDCSKNDSPTLCEFKTVFRLKIGWNFANCPSIFENSSPLNFFSKNFKIIVESSQITHSIGNFILKNFKMGHFWESEHAFFVIKFPIEWAIGELSTIILKFLEKKISMGKNFRKSRGSSRNFNRFSI